MHPNEFFSVSRTLSKEYVIEFYGSSGSYSGYQKKKRNKNKNPECSTDQWSMVFIMVKLSYNEG